MIESIADVEGRAMQQKNGHIAGVMLGVGLSLALSATGAFAANTQTVPTWKEMSRYSALRPAPGPLIPRFILGDEGPDFDEDGIPDHLDALPADPRESVDSDGDGVGNRFDFFPFDKNRHRWIQRRDGFK